MWKALTWTHRLTEGWGLGHRTTLTSPLVIEVPVPSPQSERSCICVLEYRFCLPVFLWFFDWVIKLFCGTTCLWFFILVSIYMQRLLKVWGTLVLQISVNNPRRWPDLLGRIRVEDRCPTPINQLFVTCQRNLCFKLESLPNTRMSWRLNSYSFF